MIALDAQPHKRLSYTSQTITPEFAKIIPEGQEESAITPDQRAQLARAWRGFAAGLSGSSE